MLIDHSVFTCVSNLPVGKISVARPRCQPGIRRSAMAQDAAVSLRIRKAFADRRRDPETKREAVLQTAAQLFLEKSYGRTSMNDVADRLNITKPALYHYFRNKEEILVEIYRLGADLIDETLDSIEADEKTGLDKVT